MNKNPWIYISILALLIPLFLINIRNSHDWGDDFAQYIHQAINITKGIPQSETGYIYDDQHRGVDMPARPIGFPVILAPINFLFGNNIKAFSITITFILVVLCMALLSFFRNYFSNRVSILLVLIFAYNPFTLNFKMEIMSDIPFTLFLFLTILFYFRTKENLIKNCLQTGIFIGFLISIRTIGITFLAAIVINELKNLWMNRNSMEVKIMAIKRIAIITISSFSIYILFNVILFPIPLTGLNAYFNSITFHNFFGTMQRKFGYYLEIFQNFFLSGMGVFPSLAILTQSAVVTFTMIGFINKCLKKVDFIDILTVIYLLALFLYPDTNSGLRFLFPLLPILMYYTTTGLMSATGFIINKKIIVISLSLFIFIHYAFAITKIVNHQNETLVGPQEKESIEVFEYIKQNTSFSTVIAFIKPRALALYTGRKTLLTGQSSDAIESRFKTHGVNYLLEDIELPDEDLKTFIENNQNKVHMIWSNSKFHLYELHI